MRHRCSRIVGQLAGCDGRLRSAILFMSPQVMWKHRPRPPAGDGDLLDQPAEGRGREHDHRTQVHVPRLKEADHTPEGALPRPPYPSYACIKGAHPQPACHMLAYFRVLRAAAYSGACEPHRGCLVFWRTEFIINPLYCVTVCKRWVNGGDKTMVFCCRWWPSARLGP